MSTAEELLEAGNWAAARDAFVAELDGGESAAGWDGLARASRALEDTVGAARAWERAYRMQVRQDPGPEAARMAAALAEVALASSGDAAVGKGWLERARHHLRDSPDHPALSMVASIQAYVALAYDKDPLAARTFGEEALAQASRLGDTPSEITAKAHLGLVLVSTGDVLDGMRLLDEATAAASGGEIDIDAALDTYCVLITACERVRDYDRVRQWARHVIDAPGTAAGSGFVTFARTEYSHVLVQTGEWESAERQLRQIITNSASRPVGAAMAHVFLADLLIQRGTLEEAEHTLEALDREPWSQSVRHMLMATRASLLLAQGETQEAGDLAQRYLRVVSAEARTERVGVLETLVRASLRNGEPDTAIGAVDELAAISETIPTEGVRAAASAAAGLLHADRGNLDVAVAELADALDLYEEASMLPSVASIRLELARLHLARGEPGRATSLAERAGREARELGAVPVAEAAATVLAGLRHPNGGQGELTAREVEVLRLLATGATNSEIADELFLSLRTVERHVSNIYLKIRATGASARATATAWAYRNGIT